MSLIKIIYLFPRKKKKKSHIYFSQLFSADDTTWIYIIFCPQKVEKNNPQKLLRNTQFFSSLLAWAAQTPQIEESMFQNVAYRPTVYKIMLKHSMKIWKRWMKSYFTNQFIPLCIASIIIFHICTFYKGYLNSTY